YDKEYYVLTFDFHAAAVDSVLNDTISSDNLPYLWRGAERWGASLSVDTTYVENHYFADDSECVDTVFTLNLHVDVVESVVLADTLCQGDTLLWHCQQVYASGTYYDTLRYASTGNDSIRYALSVLVQKDSVAPLQEVILCNNDSLLWFDGTWIRESGFYEYQSKYAPTLYQEAAGLEGCDSVYHSIVVVARHVRDTVLTDTICESDAAGYTWHGLTPDIPSTDLETKTYYVYDTARYIGSTECDSIRYTLELTVQRATRMAALDTTVCKDDVIDFRWKPYNTEYSGFTVTTTKFDTARYSVTGCDSVIYQLNLRVLAPLADTVVTDTTLCYTEAMEWFGQTYNEAGRYEHTVFYTDTECDSVYCRLQLHYYAEPDTVPDAITICEGAQPYLWHGQTITTDGIYWDSTYYDGTQCINRYFKLEVSMLSPSVVDTTATFCQGGSFLWDRSGELLTDTGTYVYKIPYQVLDGCDSLIIHLHLGMIEPQEMPVETAYICDGENYVWHGHTYNATGVYLDTIASVLTGCDSLFYTLNLERQPAMQTQKDTLYICNGEPVVWPFNQQTYTHGGIYNHTIPSAHGCDSIAGELRVVERTTDVQAPENISIYATQSYTWINGVTYTKAGSYDYVVPFLDGNCDSIIYTLNLTVLDIAHTTVEITEIICPGETYESRVINERTQWSDTVRAIDPSGALVDSIYNYDIDVYEFTMPDGFMGFVVAACGLPVKVDSALTLLQMHIDSFYNYAKNATVAWSYREDNGPWTALDGTTALNGQTENVTVRCKLSTDCGEKTQEQSYEVGKRATPETFTDYDLLPVIVKYNGTMLMVDVDAICSKFGWTNGVEITPEVVQWYQRVGKTDNLSYPDPNDPKDIPTNKWGYYYVPSNDLDYYALIKGKLEVQEEDCGVWARTLVVEGASPIQLNPNVSQGGASIAVTGTPQCYVTISDMYGNQVMSHTSVSGSFKAPANAGTYFVTIESDNSVSHRTLIVY
ncbi:MAG: T9SS type A sorting domain-containing protein, partial [Paludibacteraceae bacterium]|nr:T9SS type A sorting domain-containing protein [Paludibacteraceae bacterium]